MFYLQNGIAYWRGRVGVVYHLKAALLHSRSGTFGVFVSVEQTEAAFPAAVAYKASIAGPGWGFLLADATLK